MQSADIHHLELIILFIMALVVALAALARRFHMPYPIVLVIGGLAVSLFPNMPRVVLNPDIVFLVLLPPLLFAAAFQTPWRNFRQSLTKSSMMAFGFVGFSVAIVAIVTGWLLPGFDRRIGFVLGALVASTDAIAATSIARRMRLPQRLVDVLEGESLLNDATSLLALEFSVAMLVADSTPGLGQGMLRLVTLVAGGILLGLLAGWIIRWCQRRLTDAPLEITLTLIAPYVAYIAAEAMHSSGVLATVVCGLYLGEKQSESLSARARIEATAVWDTLDFALNGVVFALIGFQLPYVLEGIRNLRPAELLLDASILVGLLIALRLLWVYAVSWIAFAVRKLAGQAAQRPRGNEIFIFGWTGMRGVIALAAAMSLPQSVAGGDAFPQRDVLIFLTFCVILVTLVAQGLSLPFFINKLKVSAEQPEASSAPSEFRLPC
jgi:monovalent cation/hydrogen antiporter